MTIWWRAMGAILLASAATGVVADDFEDDYESKRWQEIEVQLPVAPSEKTLIPFFASAATENRFFVDGATITSGSDGVVRYVLVVISNQGARNVTFEGMRCETRERRVYALGRSDGTWSKSRRNEWVRVSDAYANRHHAALYLEYFCPVGLPVKNAAEARDALVRGRHPDLPR